MNITSLGQVFTPAHIVDKMIRLRRNHGRILEPSAGIGAFISKLEIGAVGIEIDKTLQQDSRVVNTDFFSYPIAEKFDTIIGNPPYVRYQDIQSSTKQLLKKELFDGRSNLYLFFIDKCIDHLNNGGELIFITPRDFLKATSSRKLNEKLYCQGSITHYYEMGDVAIFKKVAPNCAIWRWEKGRKSRKLMTGETFCFQNGQLWFGERGTSSRLGDYFEVKVGAVSGADDVFVNEKRGFLDMVCSTTAKDGKTRRVIFNRKDQSLLKHKDKLMKRRIRKFNESNWWMWGRSYCKREGPRIYVNVKTRNKNPFYVSGVEAYDGSVLALFPKYGTNLENAARQLNKLAWDSLGFICDGRFLFTQKSLESAPVRIG